MNEHGTERSRVSGGFGGFGGMGDGEIL